MPAFSAVSGSRPICRPVEDEVIREIETAAPGNAVRHSLRRPGFRDTARPGAVLATAWREPAAGPAAARGLEAKRHLRVLIASRLLRAARSRVEKIRFRSDQDRGYDARFMPRGPRRWRRKNPPGIHALNYFDTESQFLFGSDMCSGFYTLFIWLLCDLDSRELALWKTRFL